VARENLNIIKKRPQLWCHTVHQSKSLCIAILSYSSSNSNTENVLILLNTLFGKRRKYV